MRGEPVVLILLLLFPCQLVERPTHTARDAVHGVPHGLPHEIHGVLARQRELLVRVPRDAEPVTDRTHATQSRATHEASAVADHLARLLENALLLLVVQEHDLGAS